MAAIIRPGSRTSNSIIRRQENAGGGAAVRNDKWWIQRVRFSDFTTAGVTQALDLNVYFGVANAFPAGVFILPGSYINLVQVFAGGVVATAVMLLGDAGATNGLVTSSNVFTGATLGPTVTPAAAEYRLIQYEAGFLPLLTLTTTTGNVNTCTSGVVDVYIPYSVRPLNRGV